ncbi:S1C family serine protease [Ornithinimicrobium avium]|uniref:PDZ domain-containing protein n=1 Tax=Ornithinimicrobium avium TaxID=2283195 RepID=A0A345NQY6_9MICO|nr:trypsin-like peptidase domain-containing protein [Ornithinimicrobium avium]AXH97444.1 PDZ domain-containing protein [Ornithinimicrobium avium]
MTTTPDQPGPAQPDPTRPVPQGPGAAGPAPAPQPRTQHGAGRRWGDIGIAALLAAVLASGGTWAVTQGSGGGGVDAVGTTQSPTADTAPSGPATTGSPASLGVPQDWSTVAAEVSPSVVSIEVANQQGVAAGSGVVWDTKGHVVTNAHVVEGAQQVRVVFADGRTYAATVAGTDPSSDLAVLTVTDGPSDLTPIRVGDDSALKVGDPVMAIGNPLGLSGTVTTGIVSALDRPVTTRNPQSGSPFGQGSSTPQEVVTNAIQTSAAINPGNSGGALVNASGELVGINSSIASLPSGGQSQPGSIGIGFAIPAREVQLIADQLIRSGKAEHAFLGIYLDNGSTQVDGATMTGALVKQVEPDSPASSAGLKEGDLIIGMDGEDVPSATALVGQVRERGAGDQVQISYVRDGQQQQTTVTLATRPDEG